ncbi:hypothetical protein [Methylobacterium sp. GC_Met_2]|uniref:hypothetical protein n=1 Tax=Methylobacterium sp. GC_Met_2 TaxID=2937376 RepID=UPI00226B481D|nr:hypothetical protein [Methylobacterium sp. GC_Met_2]
MSQDEALRMAAEVIDKSTGPLKNIAATLRGVAREGQAHSEALAKGMGRVESGMKGAASAASNVLTPALATVGITGLTLTATIAGIGAAMRNFGGGAKELGQLSRDTGIAASTLRNVQGVLSAVGVDAATSGQALQKFAEDARLAHRGYGPLMEFLRRQGKDESGRKYFNDIADGIMRSKDAGEAYMRALHGQEGIKDPVERRIYADNVLKLGDAARLADGRLGSLDDQIKRYQRNNGIVSDKDIADAEAYARAMDGLQGTMNKLYNAAARELTPSLTAAAVAVKKFMDDQRNGVESEVVKTIRDIQTELGKINWKQAGTDALSFLSSTTALAGSLAHSLHVAAEALHDLEKGDIAEALRKSTGGGGTVGRLVNKFYPRADSSTPESEALDAQMRGQTMSPDELRGNQNLRQNGSRVAEIEARQAELRTKLDQFGLMEKSGTASDRSKSQAEDLRREMTRLTEELKRIREGGATVQQQSFDATGSGLGGLIQKASYGGGGGLPAIRQMLRTGGGIYAPGGGGYGVGDTGDSGGRGPALPGLDSPAGQVGRTLRGRGGSMPGVPDNVPMTADERNTLGLIQKYESHGQNTMNYVGQRQGLSPLAAKGYTAQGYYQILNSNWRRLAPGLGIKAPNAMAGSLEEQTRVALALLRGSGGKPKDWAPFNPSLRAAIARGEQAPVASVPNIPPIGERPRISSSDSDFLPNGSPSTLKPNSMTDAPGVTMDQVNVLRASRADGAGWAAREAARRSYEARGASEAERAKALELRPAARSALQNSLRGGTTGATQAAERALMDVRIHNPGPNTRASVVAKGSMFGEVKQMTGRQMRSSDDI